jgi:transcriptional regulator with XRE-family HTH domain
MVTKETNIGKVIELIRKSKGISQEELAYELGIKQPTVSLIEKGERTPNTNKLLRISEVLGVPLPILAFYSINLDKVDPLLTRDAKAISSHLLELIEKEFSN